MITPRIAAVVLVTALLVPDIQAASPLRGRLLYENFCHHCHMTEIHFRVNSKVDSWGKLLHLVAIWQQEMELGWRAQEVMDVASYLNRVYYRLPGSGFE
jgi:hypothetical protein